MHLELKAKSCYRSLTKNGKNLLLLKGNAVVEDKAKLRIISQVCNILQELNIQLFLYLIFRIV